MIYLFAAIVLSSSFVALFALWLLVWTFTMSDEAPANVATFDRSQYHPRHPTLEVQATTQPQSLAT